MKFKLILMAGLLSVGPMAMAEDEATDGARAQGQHRTWTNAAGNTVEAYRVRGENAEGTKGRARGYRVTDADGNVVRGGRDRAYVREDGSRGRAHARTRVRDDGAVVQNRARARQNADGDVVRTRGKRVIR